MAKQVLNYGDAITAPYVFPDPIKRGEFAAEMRPAIVIGFSNYSASRRDWGWRGDALVEFADGAKSWTSLH